MWIIKLAIPLLFFYSNFSYSHSPTVSSVVCQNDFLDLQHNDPEPHWVKHIKTFNDDGSCTFSDDTSDPNYQPQACAENQNNVTINNNDSGCSSATIQDIALTLHQNGYSGEGVTIQQDETTGDITVITDQPITNEESGIYDLPEPDDSGSIPITYNPSTDLPSDTKVTYVPPEVITNADITTKKEQTVIENTVTGQTTYETTTTTTNTTTGDTTTTYNTTVLNPDGTITESQNTVAGNTNDQEEGSGSISGGSTCNTPPSRSGDISDEDFNILLQNYYIRCPQTELTNNDSQGFGNEYQTVLDQAETDFDNLLSRIQSEFNSQFSIVFSNTGGGISSNVQTIKGANVDFSLSKYSSTFSYIGLFIIFIAYYFAFTILMER